MVLGASYFTGDRPKSNSSGMSNKAPPPVARMGTRNRSRLRSPATRVPASNEGLRGLESRELDGASAEQLGDHHQVIRIVFDLASHE